MVSGIPVVSDKLREMIERLVCDPSEVIERVYRALIALDASYAGLGSAARKDVHNHIAFSVDLWLKTLVTGSRADAEDLLVVEESGRRRVYQGVALPSLLRAYRLGSLELWRAILEFGRDDPSVRDELLFGVSPYLLDHFDHMAHSVAAAYIDEQYQRVRWREALRYELVSIVFTSPEDGEAFRKTCVALGVDPTAPRVALALDMTLPDVLPSRLERELDRIELVMTRQLKLKSGDLIRALHRGRLLVWLPGHRGDSMLSTDRQMLAHARSLMKVVPEIQAVGVGLMNQGAMGWATSVDEAFNALENGKRQDDAGKPPLFLYSDVAISESVLQSGNVLRYLDSIIERLSHEPDLLSTLSVYFEHGQHRKQASVALGIHPNTLNYRLERIEALIGARLDDAGWVSRLDVAMRLRGKSRMLEV